MAENKVYKLTKEQVDSIDLLRNSNKVLVRIEEKNIEKKTDSGIYLISPTDTDWNPAAHSDRYGVVYATPPSLRFDNTPYGMSWETHMELMVGDEVWFDFMDSENCVVLDCDDGNDYKLIEYENIYVARRDGELIPINGYCLFSDYTVKAKSKFDPTDGRVDPRFGIVEHIAYPNMQYETKMFEDVFDLQQGDKVMFGSRAKRYYVEDDSYKRLDKMYRPVQRRNVVAIMDGEVVAELADGAVMVKPYLERVTPKGIIVPVHRQDVQHFKAEVIMSNNPEVMVGDWVLCPKSSPLKYMEEEVEYFILNREDIWFVWNE